MQKSNPTPRYRGVLKIFAVILAIIFVFWINTFNVEGTLFAHYAERLGYVGLFFVAVVSGFNVLLPVPVAALYPSLLSLGFHPFWTIAVISLGMVIGDVVGYFLGYIGRGMMTDTKQRSLTIMRYVDTLAKKHRFLPVIALFIFVAFVPLPNELIVVPLGFLRVSFWKIIITVFCGNILFNTLIALGFFHIPGLFL